MERKWGRDGSRLQGEVKPWKRPEPRLTYQPPDRMIFSMQTHTNGSNKPSTGSEAWTPEQKSAWLERVHQQDQASAKIRRSLGQVVTQAGYWQHLLKAKAGA
jgi:hypothetical protein